MILRYLSTHEKRSDLLGSFASGLCLIHCLATPFLFLGQYASVSFSAHLSAPAWWNTIDVVLLLVSLAAVYWTSKNTTQRWVRYALFANWLFLTAFILNEKLDGIHLIHELIYIPTIALIVLHEYNRRYCVCKDDSCCVTS